MKNSDLQPMLPIQMFGASFLHRYDSAKSNVAGWTTGFSQRRREPVSARIIGRLLCPHQKGRQAISSLAENQVGVSLFEQRIWADGGWTSREGRLL
jgi:hypothetical protein